MIPTSPAPPPVPGIDAAHVIETMHWAVQPDGTYLDPEGCRYPASFPELMAEYLRRQQRIADAVAKLAKEGT